MKEVIPKGYIDKIATFHASIETDRCSGQVVTNRKEWMKMNKVRRKRIDEIKYRLAELQEEMESLMDDIDSVYEEESEYRDNMPENLQGSERYEVADAACDNLESAKDSLEELKDQIDDVVSALEEAQG